GAVVKSTDGANTWGTPLQLTATAHPADGALSASLDVRDLKVDPTNSSRILVATDDGFYISTNGGTSFSIVDMPHTAGAPPRQSPWNSAYMGQNGGNSSGAVSGVWACPGFLPPVAGGGLTTCPGNAAEANWGDVWTSTDSGATWTSARVTGRFPATV